MPEPVQTPAKGSIPSHILDALLKSFGMGGINRQPDAIEGHYNRMQEEDPEDFGNSTKPQGLPGPGASAPVSGKPGSTAMMHPKLQMLMAKLSPTQEEEPEGSSEFSPGRMESGMA